MNVLILRLKIVVKKSCSVLFFILLAAGMANVQQSLNGAVENYGHR
jgi:hypothetical protein